MHLACPESALLQHATATLLFKQELADFVANANWIPPTSKLYHYYLLVRPSIGILVVFPYWGWSGEVVWCTFHFEDLPSGQQLALMVRDVIAESACSMVPACFKNPASRA